jgi:hypothetical protein
MSYVIYNPIKNTYIGVDINTALPSDHVDIRYAKVWVSKIDAYKYKEALRKSSWELWTAFNPRVKVDWID